MTDQPAAIKGTFSEIKFVKTRKICQIVIEIPIEQADEALAVLGGVPRPDAERWVAIARLSEPQTSLREQVDVVRAEAKHAREHRAFCDLPMSKQTGIKADDHLFSAFLFRNYGHLYPMAGSPEDIIRMVCGVASRREITPSTPAGDRWISLLREFEGVR